MSVVVGKFIRVTRRCCWDENFRVTRGSTRTPENQEAITQTIENGPGQDEYYSLIFARTLTKRWWSSSYWHAISSIGEYFVNVTARLKEDFITVSNDRRNARIHTPFRDYEQTELRISAGY